MSKIISLNKTKLKETNNQKKEKRFLSKKSMILGTLATVLVATPLSYTVYHVSNQANTSVWFDGKSFKSKNDVYNYVENNSIVESYKTESHQDSKWVLKLGNLEQVFSTPEALRQYVFNNQLSVEDYVTSLDLNKFVDKSTGVLDIDQVIGQIHKGKVESVPTSTVYKGRGDSIKTDVNSAYDSYFAPREAFYFNNMFFNSQAMLKQYLVNEYLPNNVSSYNSFTVVAPNGAVSVPIKADDVNAGSYLTNFINSNIQKVVEYSDPSTNTKINITTENVDKVVNQVNSGHFSYQHVLSNQGQSRYVIDNSVEDDYNLIGPYFYNGNLDIASFNNKNMWKKVSGMQTSTKHKVAYQESKIDNMIGSFFTSIMNDDNELNKEQAKEENRVPTLFRTTIQDANGNLLDESYLNQLKAYDVEIYDQVITANASLMKGKKYNTFYKFPIMYSFIMQRLINKIADQKIINATIDYFGQVADFLQDILEIVVLDQRLLIRNDGTKFDVKSLFRIGDSSLDLNTTPEYYMSEIKTYSKLIAAISAYTGAVNNLNMLGGLMTYSGYDQNYLFEFKIIDKAVYYSDEVYNACKNIFETFSQLNMKDVFAKWTVNSQLEEVKKIQSLPIDTQMDILDKTSLRTKSSPIYKLLTGVAASNVAIHELHNAALRTEVAQYSEDKKFDINGYLYKIEEKVDWFLQYTVNNPDDDWYRTYLLILTDLRQGTGVFNTPASLLDNMQYIHNVGRLTALSFASPFLLVRTINDLYWFYRIRPNLTHKVAKFSSLFSTLGKSISSKYSEIKKALTPGFMKRFYWRYDIPNLVFTKWDVLFFFCDVDNKVIPFMDKMAPIFGTAFAIFELFAFICEFINVETFTDYYVYTTADGTEFIWDGGQTTSALFGFDVKETNSISDMKLIEPIQFTLPQVQQFYYYNQVKYYSLDDLKRDQLRQMLYGKVDLSLNNYFNYKYSFTSVNNAHQTSFNTEAEVLSNVLSSLGVSINSNGTLNISNLNKNSDFFGGQNFSFSNGISSNTAAHDVIASNIVQSIRPTSIVKLPDIVDGVLIDSNNAEFKLPGIVWNNGSLINNIDVSGNYIIDNSANLLKDGSTQLPVNGVIYNELFAESNPKVALENSKKNLLNAFKTRFVIPSKKVLTSSYLSSNSYSSLSSDINSVSVYKATLPQAGTTYFTDRLNAERWILKNINFEKYSVLVEDKKYIYNNQLFKTKKELIQFVDSQISK